VRRHGLAPLAYRHGLAEFRADFAAAAIRADQQRAIAAEAVATLAAVGVPAALYKGISYGAWLYADPGERPMTDVDLIVRAGDHPRAVAALQRLGYWHPGPAIQRSPRHHAITLKRRNASLDLHRSPVQHGRLAIDWDAVWARTSDAPWVPGARRLDPIDEVLFHFAHLARQDLIAPLLAFVDGARLLATLDGPGWTTLLSRARAMRFARVLDAAIDLVEHVVGHRDDRSRWWLPSKIEVLQGKLPARLTQIGRKLLLVEGPAELRSYAVSVLDGVIAARFRAQAVNAGADTGVQVSEPRREP
jgi:hypothetical protein